MTTLSYRNINTESANLTDKARDYLLQYGWAQSLQDSIAGYAKELKDEGKSESVIADAIKDALAERAADILSGTIGSRVGGPRKSPVEKEMHRLASLEYAVAFKRKHPKDEMPKGAALTERVNQLVKARESVYRKQAEANLAKLDKVDAAIDALI